MKLVVIACFLSATILSAQEFEEPPLLNAADILKPEILSGPQHRVLPNVTTLQGRNHYTVETPWGNLTADGDALLLARIAEVKAMAELQKVSRTDEFKTSLKTAAKLPLQAVGGILDDPKAAVKGTATGVWKFMNRAGESVKNVAQGRALGQGEDGAVKSLLGLSKAKRALALQLGADPYSSNEIFQLQLEKVAWVISAGTGAFQIATLPIGGGAGLALTATEASQHFQNDLREFSPPDLRLASKKKLVSMGIEPENADRFLANPAFSPTNQTAFVEALKSMTGVEIRENFVTLAATTATEEGDAVFFSGTAQLLASMHAGEVKIEKIIAFDGLPVADTQDGRLVVALVWDTAFWSENAERFIDRICALRDRPMIIAITGTATSRTKAELEKRKITLMTHILPGPQK